MLKSKTIWFAALIAAFGALQVGISDMQALIPPDVYGYINIAIGTVVAALRAVTTVSLSEK